MTFTAEQVEAALAENFVNYDLLYDAIGWNYYEHKESDRHQHVQKYLEDEYTSLTDLLDWVSIADELDGTPKTITIDGKTVEVVCVQWLGGMDEGSTANITIRVGDQFFTKEGWYQSHYGYEYDGDFYETQPRARTVIDYVKS